jgi:hypothetical protein
VHEREVEFALPQGLDRHRGDVGAELRRLRGARHQRITRYAQARTGEARRTTPLAGWNIHCD